MNHFKLNSLPFQDPLLVNFLEMFLVNILTICFPGFSAHKELVRRFFRNASQLLQPQGEIHVTRKIGHPYDSWDLEKVASESSLVLIEIAIFQKEDYPGYNQKRGSGAKCDQPFKLDPCCTFKFRRSEA